MNRLLQFVALSVLDVVDLAFGYGAEPLFQGVSFRLNAGERAALVAPNGAGKSTLLRLIAGELTADRGSVVIAAHTRLGYYRQSHELAARGNVLDALLGGFSELVELRAELVAAERRAASNQPNDLAGLAEIMDRWEHSGGHSLEQRVEAIATRLGFSHADMSRSVASLSGGERGRLVLGTVLATEPDLLLLDEPTNHLDIDTIRWLEGHLRDWRGALLVVSHDRAFLDGVCPQTFELGRRTFRTYPLAYSAYQAAREEDLEREASLAEQQAAFVARTEEFIRRNIAGQKTKQAKSRRKLLDKLERLEQPEDVWASAERVRFRFADAPRSGDLVLEARELRAERGGRLLFEGLDVLMKRGDRIGIIGANGCGKSTLLRLLAGLGAAEDGGSVRRGTNLCDGFFDQHLGSLNPERSGVEEIRSIRGDFNVDVARQYLARFRFWGDDPMRRVASLSGGERTRLALAKLLLEPRNLLFLDEPTNHLDIFAAEILEEALCGFEGTVLLVSHDRRLLERVTTRTLSFGRDGLDLYDGGFADFERSLARAQAAREEAREKASANDSDRTSRAESDRARRREAERKAQRARERKARRTRELEESIAKAEADLAELRKRLSDVPGDDWEKVHEWAEKERALCQNIERMTEEWAALGDELAAQQEAAR